jgi:hypothetical protein
MKWKEFEKRVAKEVGGKRKKRSGGSKFLPSADVESDTHLIEVKTTVSHSFNLKLEDLRKLRERAAIKNKSWAMQVNIGDERVAIVPWYEFSSFIKDKRMLLFE